MNIRLHFDGFWNGFTPHDNLFVWVLSQKHNVVIDDINPNLVFTLDRKKFKNAFFKEKVKDIEAVPGLIYFRTSFTDYLSRHISNKNTYCKLSNLILISLDSFSR